ncbi:ATP-binding protein [Planctomycetota bacterium]|nr:ATP-binding protein [Planctomycetota bacterium]
MAPGSIERRVVVSATVAMTVTVLGTGGLIFEAYRSGARSDGEQGLASTMAVGAERAVAEAVFASRSGDQSVSAERAGPLSQYAWICWRAGEAEELCRSTGFPAVKVPRVESREPGSAGVPTDLQFVETVGEDGLHYRIATASFVPRLRGLPSNRRGDGRGGRRERDRRVQRPSEPPFLPGDQFLLLTLAPMQEEFQRSAELARLMLLGGAGALLAAALLIRSSVRRGMAPLGALARTIEGLGEGNLDESVQLSGAPLELAPIVDALEQSRARLAESFAREQRFTDDVAHELRTPLAGLRAALEVALRRKRSPEELEEVLHNNLSAALDLQQIVDSLLLLRRSGSAKENAEAVDLRGEMERAFGEQEEALETRSLTVVFRTEGSGPHLGSGAPAVVRRITSNLARNAAGHADVGSTISVTTRSNPEFATLVVENPSKGISEEAAIRAFEPFWRADRARSAGDQHVGLGLAIVEGCVSALGGRAAVTTEDGLFRITIELPVG